MIPDLYRSWIVERIDAIKAAGHARELADAWTGHLGDVPTMRTDHVHTHPELDRIAAVVASVEAHYRMPFIDDPRSKPSPWADYDDLSDDAAMRLLESSSIPLEDLAEMLVEITGAPDDARLGSVVGALTIAQVQRLRIAAKSGIPTSESEPA